MNPTLKLIGLFFVAFLLSACSSPYPGYAEKESGLLFKLETIEDGNKRITPNSYLQFKYCFKNYKNEVLDESRILMKVNDVYASGGLLEVLSLVNQKEIASAIFPAGKLREELDGGFKLNNVPDTSLLFVQVQVDSVYKEDEFHEARKKFIAWVNKVETKTFDVEKEELLLDAFEKENELSTNISVTGLRYFFIRKGDGPDAGFGNRVALKYSGRFLNGDVFNSTEALDDGVQEFYLGDEMQVIKGIEEALLFMREGDVVVLLMPSWLAFGKSGSSTGLVPANSPVLYELELKRVN